jgi:hypothetical protein
MTGCSLFVWTPSISEFVKDGDIASAVELFVAMRRVLVGETLIVANRMAQTLITKLVYKSTDQAVAEECFEIYSLVAAASQDGRYKLWDPGEICMIFHWISCLPGGSKSIKHVINLLVQESGVTGSFMVAFLGFSLVLDIIGKRSRRGCVASLPGNV